MDERLPLQLGRVRFRGTRHVRIVESPLRAVEVRSNRSDDHSMTSKIVSNTLGSTSGPTSYTRRFAGVDERGGTAALAGNRTNIYLRERTVARLSLVF